MVESVVKSVVVVKKYELEGGYVRHLCSVLQGV